MKGLLILLIVCFVVIVVLILCLQFYIPKKPVTFQNASLYTTETPTKELSYNSYQLLKEMDLQWPHLNIMFKKENTEATLFLKWAGTVREEKIVLFYLRDYDSIHSFLEACDRMNEAHETPKYRFVIAMDHFEAVDNGYYISDYLRRLEQPVIGAYTDGSGIKKSSPKDLFYVSGGRKAELVFDQEGNEWMRKIDLQKFIETSGMIDEFYENFQQDLSWIMKLQYSFHKTKFIQNFIHCYPELRNQLMPSIVMDDTSVRIYCTSTRQKKALYEYLEGVAKKNGSSLEPREEIHSIPCAMYGPLDQYLEEVVEKDLRFCKMVRILGTPEDFDTIPGITTRGFTIKENRAVLKGELSVSFYHDLLV